MTAQFQAEQAIRVAAAKVMPLDGTLLLIEGVPTESSIASSLGPFDEFCRSLGAGHNVEIEVRFLSAEDEFFSEVGVGFDIEIDNPTVQPFQQGFIVDANPNISVNVGRTFNSERFDAGDTIAIPELSFEYIGGSLDTETLFNLNFPGTAPAAGDIRYDAFMVNGGLKLPISARMDFQVNGGIGVGRQGLDNVVAGGATWIGDDTGFVYKVGAGINHKLDDYWSLGVEVNHIEFQDFNGRLNVGNPFTIEGVSRTGVDISLRYEFSGLGLGR